MIHNFRVASATADKHQARMAAVTEDIVRLMSEGGIERVEAEQGFKFKLSKLIRESIEDEFSLTDPTAIFTNRRTAALGDKVEIERKHNTLRVVKYSPQSQPLIFSPVKSKYTVSTSMYELAYGLELFKVMTRQHSVEEFVKYAAQAITRHSLKVVLTAINAACGAGATDQRGRALRHTLGTADVSKTELDAAIRRMGPGVTIFGSRWALSPIHEFGATTDPAKEELRTRGSIGVYRGCRMVALEDDYNEYAEKWTSVGGVDWEKLLFIAAPEKGAVYLERDLNALQWSEIDAKTATFEAGLRMDHGIFVDKPYKYHVIQLA